MSSFGQGVVVGVGAMAAFNAAVNLSFIWWLSRYDDCGKRKTEGGDGHG